MNDLDLCRAADHCRTRTPGPNGTSTPGEAGGRGLCWPDELHGRLAIEQLPHDWLQLTVAARKTAGANGVPTFGGHKAEPPIPILGEPDALARNIAWLLDVWAAAVWAVIPVAEEGRRGDFAETGVRPGYAVARSAGLLSRFYPALRSLGPTVFMPYGENHELPVEEDGPGAIVTLADLHHRARSFLGDTKRWEPRDLPCPPAPHGCGLDGVLSREIGETVVRCRNCGWWCTTDEYQGYAITFQPPRLGRCPDCNVTPGTEHRGGCDVARCLHTGRQRLACRTGQDGAIPAVTVEVHDCGHDVWTGLWPGVREAQQYGVDLNILTTTGVWDPASARWYMGDDAP